MAGTTRSRTRAATAETATDTRAETAQTPDGDAARASTATSDPEEVRAQTTGTTSTTDPAAEQARAEATGTTSSPTADTAPGAVETVDGAEHVGTVPATAELVNPAVGSGDHDRVAMLSVNADGTADQHAPEIIVDVAVARAATREQFTQQAVSAADTRLAAQSAATAGPGVTIIGTPEGQPDQYVPATTDATAATTEIAAVHDQVVAAAEAAADAVVDRLTSGS